MTYNFNYAQFRTLIFDLGYKSEKNFFEETRTPKSTFQNIKNGTCDLSTVKRLCEILKCEITDLFPSDRLLNVKNESYISKCKKIAVLSQRTGVGVTSFSVNLAQMLERRRYKTLIVELGESVSFDILEKHNKNTKQKTTQIGDLSLEINIHGPWLDSLQLTDSRDENSLFLFGLKPSFHSKNSVNLDLSSLKEIFEELVKENHYDYIVFSCRRFPFASALQREFNHIFGPEQFVKLADIALVGFETHLVNINQIKLLIKWLSDLKIEIFVADFMRKKKDFFFNIEYEQNNPDAYFDKILYNKITKERKSYLKTLSNTAKQYKNVHILKQFITFFDGHNEIYYLDRSVFSTVDSKLKSKVRNYKYQIKNLFEEIDAFEREV
jgi:hypothetical protein